jgi:metal-responsive CopG/Arc/MetJ family transcriptional regulator
MENVHELRPKTPDSEKITVNLGFIDLGRVDLMVRDGFYANRADFIRTAIRNQLARTAGRRSPPIGGAQAAQTWAVALHATGS